jgi:hypothetical protein
VIAAFAAPSWARVQPWVAAAQPSAPSLHSLSRPAEPEPEAVARPTGEAPAVVVAGDRVETNETDGAAAGEKSRKPAPSVKPRIGHAERVKRELARLSRSAGVRACLAVHRPESLRAELEVDAASGRVVRLSAQPLMRGSALEKCVARESQGWRLPTGDANYKGTQEFKLP